MTRPQEQAARQLEAIEKAIGKAIGKWEQWNVSIGSIFGTPQDQVLGAIRSMESTGFASLKRRALKIPATDQAAWDAWTQEARVLVKNLDETAQMSSDVTLTAIVAETVKATAKTVKRSAEKVAAVAGEVWDARRWIVVGLVSIALVVVVVKVVAPLIGRGQ